VVVLVVVGGSHPSWVAPVARAVAHALHAGLTLYGSWHVHNLTVAKFDDMSIQDPLTLVSSCLYILEPLCGTAKL